MLLKKNKKKRNEKKERKKKEFSLWRNFIPPIKKLNFYCCSIFKLKLGLGFKNNPSFN